MYTMFWNLSRFDVKMAMERTMPNSDRLERNGSKPAGIKQIAQALGVSIGTVDRALHGRPGINPLTRAKVLKMAQTLGYRPNLAARFLKSQRRLQISVQLPVEIATFFDALRSGIREAAAPFEPAVHVEFRSYPNLGEGDAAVFNEALAEGAQGMIIAPGEPSVMKPLIRKAARRSVPVVCVATDAPGTERLAAVTACPYTNGAIVGELLGRLVHGPGSVGVVTGSLATEDHADKLEGFRSSLGMFGGGLEIARVLEAHDNQQLGYSGTKAMLAQNPGLRAVYVSTANSLPALQAIEESGLASRIAVITTDLFPALVPLIRSGRVLATIYQRPMTQGRLAFQALHQFLIEGQCPMPRIRVAPHIVMSSNLDLFLERMALDAEEQSEVRGEPIWTSRAGTAIG
jgi:LacI family transcriptional regulator